MFCGYSKRQFAQSDFDASGYAFPTQEGVFKAVLDCKRHGLHEVPFGAEMELEFVKNKRGVIHLRKATVLG